MTIALCLKCGDTKKEPFVECPHCGYSPQTEEDYTIHLIMTDDYHSLKHIEESGLLVKQGRALSFDEKLLGQMWVSQTDIDAFKKKSAVWLYCLLAAIALLVFLSLCG